MIAATRRAQVWLGTLVQVEAASDGPGGAAQAHRAIDAAFAAVARVHGAMSPRLPDSDIARINAARPGAVIACDPWTIAVMRTALALQAASAGLFDPTAGSLAARRTRRTLLAGDDRDPDDRDPHRSHARLHDGSPPDRAASAKRRQAWFTRLSPCLLRKEATCCLDLGGIAKGYAVDRAVAALRAQGVRDALVNAGGDLRAIGTRAWPVNAGHRSAQAEDGAGLAAVSLRLALASGAVATSVYRAGITPGHGDTLMDPRRCRRARIDCVVTVAAPRCVLADALTKIVALSGDACHPAVARFQAEAWVH